MSERGGSPRFPHFDGLRAIAALSVVGVHSALATPGLSGGATDVALQLQFGVSAFFVISGFLLYRPFVAARLGGRAVSVRTYARRRILRIVPAYWLALTVLALWPGLPGLRPRSAWVYYGFAQEFRRSTVFEGLQVAWSLGTEMCFYAALPVLAYVLGRRVVRSAGAAVALELSALATLAVAASVFRIALPHDSHFLEDTLAGTFDWFALGMGLAVVSVYAAHSAWVGGVAAWLSRYGSLFWIGTVALLGLAALDEHVHPHPHGLEKALALHLLRGLAGFCLVVPAAFPPERPRLVHRLLATRLLVGLGLVSYGIYLWHFPLASKVVDGLARVGLPATGIPGALLTFVVLALVATACATVSYVVVERPAMRLREGRRGRTAPEPERLPAASTVAP